MNKIHAKKRIFEDIFREQVLHHDLSPDEKPKKHSQLTAQKELPLK